VLILIFDDGFLALASRLYEPLGLIPVCPVQAFLRGDLEFVGGEETKRVPPLQPRHLVTIAFGGNFPSHRSLLQLPSNAVTLVIPANA
jgi:hypothetical protein